MAAEQTPGSDSGVAATEQRGPTGRISSAAIAKLTAEHQGEFAVRRLRDGELLETTPDLARAVEVADAEAGGAYIEAFEGRVPS